MARQSSELWKEITEKHFRDVKQEDLQNFRHLDSMNSRLSSWSPTDHSSRHFKSLLWNALEHMNDDFFAYTKKIRTRDLGNPATVRYKNLDIDVDYLLAVDEILFLEKHKILSGAKTIIETGGGFGRTAHAIIECFPNIEKYTLIDLPEILHLAGLYLKTVAPDKFSKFEFISALDDYKIPSTDLFININSFQFMPVEAIEDYYTNVIPHCRAVYIKSLIGKYRPEEFHLPETRQSDKPMKLGLSQDIYTFFDQEQHETMVKKFLETHAHGWLKPVDHRRCALFHYFQHALYTNPKAA